MRDVTEILKSLPVPVEGTVRPQIHELAKRHRPGTPPPLGLKRGGLVAAAERVRRAGRLGDRHIIHVNDAELKTLERAWGPPTTNPETGAPEFFLSGLFNVISSIAGAAAPALGAIPVVGPWLGPLAQSIGGIGRSSGLYGQGAIAGGGPDSGGVYGGTGSGAYSAEAPGMRGSVGDQTTFNVGRTPVSFGNLLDLVGSGASIFGALNANKRWHEQQDSLEQRWREQRDDFNGDPVNYDFGNSDFDLVGLAPSQPVETAGFRPEEKLVERRETPDYRRGGRVGALCYAGGGPVQPQMRPQGQVRGPGDGQSDMVPAYLSRDEYVIPADVVSHLGNGSSAAGAEKLDALLERIRQQRTGNANFPPAVGNPTEREMGLQSRGALQMLGRR